MSDPAPHRPDPKASAPGPLPPTLQLPRPSRRGPGWFVISFVLHTAAVAALLWFTPLRQMITDEQPTRQRPDVTMASQRIADAAEQIEQINRDQLERDVQQLHEVLDEMDRLKQEQRKEFDVYEHQMIEQSPRAIEELTERVLQAMAAAAEALASDNPQTTEQMRNTDVLQGVAEALQQELVARLEAIDTTGELTQAQVAALEAQRQAMAAVNQHKHAAQQQQHAQQAAYRAERDLVTAQQRAQERKTQAEDLASKSKEHQARAQQLEQQRDAASEREDRAAQQQAERDRRNAQTAADRAHNQAQRSEREYAEAQKRVDELMKQVEQRQAQAQQREADRAAAQEAAVAKQVEAKTRQEVVAQQTREAARRLAIHALEQRQQQAAAEQPTRVAPDTTQMNLLQLYEAAQQAEAQVTEEYSEVRAMKLAMLREVTLDQAREAIVQFKPIRPQLDAAAIASQTRTMEQFGRKRQQIEVAVSESGSMVSLASLLLTQAQQEAGGAEGRPVSLEAIQARSAAMQQLESLASVDISGQATDVTAAMQAVAQASSGQQSDASSDVSDATPGDAQQQPVPQDGAAGSEQFAGPHVQRTGSIASDERAQPSPPTIARNQHPVFGRKVGAVGDEGATWMAVGTWYIIGPWPNPDRANIDRSFPPENLVDLDTTYVGKDGRTIGWEFVQTGNPRGVVVPTNAEEYGIWYAYTELHFDEATALWVTMGSDDKGRMWINDIPVWVSADHLKGWRPDEAMRRVHFKQGRNRILYRCENGWHGMGFSLWVHLPLDTPPPAAKP